MEFTYGGFVSNNIRKWLLKEILESGKPEDFFLAVRDELDKIEDEQMDDPDYWDKAWEEL